MPKFIAYYIFLYYNIYKHNNIYERMRFFMEKITIKSEFITLGQFLKFVDVISSGGMVKHALETLTIYVNDVLENRRGKKLYPGDKILIKTIGEFRISSK